MSMVMIAAIAFVGTHFLLSHPLRAPLVARVGDRLIDGSARTRLQDLKKSLAEVAY